MFTHTSCLHQNRSTQSQYSHCHWGIRRLALAIGHWWMHQMELLHLSMGHRQSQLKITNPPMMAEGGTAVHASFTHWHTPWHGLVGCSPHTAGCRVALLSSWHPALPHLLHLWLEAFADGYVERVQNLRQASGDNSRDGICGFDVIFCDVADMCTHWVQYQ